MKNEDLLGLLLSLHPSVEPLQSVPRPMIKMGPSSSCPERRGHQKQILSIFYFQRYANLNTIRRSLPSRRRRTTNEKWKTLEERRVNSNPIQVSTSCVCSHHPRDFLMMANLKLPLSNHPSANYIVFPISTLTSSTLVTFDVCLGDWRLAAARWGMIPINPIKRGPNEFNGR